MGLATPYPGSCYAALKNENITEVILLDDVAAGQGLHPYNGIETPSIHVNR
jgi:hypothetical protein